MYSCTCNIYLVLQIYDFRPDLMLILAGTKLAALIWILLRSTITVLLKRALRLAYLTFENTRKCYVLKKYFIILKFSDMFILKVTNQRCSCKYGRSAKYSFFVFKLLGIAAYNSIIGRKAAAGNLCEHSFNIIFWLNLGLRNFEQLSIDF